MLKELLNLGVVLRVEEQNVGEVLLLLGIGIPVAGLLGGACHSAGNPGLGNLLLSAALIGVLPFLTLSCQAIGI